MIKCIHSITTTVLFITLYQWLWQVETEVAVLNFLPYWLCQLSFTSDTKLLVKVLLVLLILQLCRLHASSVKNQTEHLWHWRNARSEPDRETSRGAPKNNNHNYGSANFASCAYDGIAVKWVWVDTELSSINSQKLFLKRIYILMFTAWTI